MKIQGNLCKVGDYIKIIKDYTLPENNNTIAKVISTDEYTYQLKVIMWGDTKHNTHRYHLNDKDTIKILSRNELILEML